jgi:hypothetical protein
MRTGLTEKRLLKVLIHCINSQTGDDVIYKPIGFLNGVKGLSSGEVLTYLRVLSDRELIELHTADYSECDNIACIVILSKAYDFLIMIGEDKKLYRKNWRWNLCAAIITAIVAALLGALLARVSYNIFPEQPIQTQPITTETPILLQEQIPGGG